MGPSVLPQFELELYASVHKQSSVFRKGKQYVPKDDRISYDRDLKKIEVIEFRDEFRKVENNGFHIHKGREFRKYKIQNYPVFFIIGARINHYELNLLLKLP